jgi:hypothetical protein
MSHLRLPSSGMLRSFNWQLPTFLDNLSVPSSGDKPSSTANFVLNDTNQLVFVMEMQFVFFAVVIELLRVNGAGLTGESHCGSPGSFLASLFEVCGGQSGVGTDSSLCCSIFPCHYHPGSDTHPPLC